MQLGEVAADCIVLLHYITPSELTQHIMLRHNCWPQSLKSTFQALNEVKFDAFQSCSVFITQTDELTKVAALSMYNFRIYINFRAAKPFYL